MTVAMPTNPGSRSAILAITAVALAVVVAACAPEFKHDLSTPQAAVRTYLGYLARAEPESAYAIFSKDTQARCSKQIYLDRSGYILDEMESSRVVVRETRVLDSRATVRATVDPGRVDVGPFGPTSTSFETTYSLIRDGVEWKLTDAGWPYGYCDSPKPVETEPPATVTPTSEATTVSSTPAAGK
jgi:hypothetical protein